MTTDRACSTRRGAFPATVRIFRLRLAIWMLRAANKLHAAANRIIEREGRL